MTTTTLLWTPANGPQLFVPAMCQWLTAASLWFEPMQHDHVHLFPVKRPQKLTSGPGQWTTTAWLWSWSFVITHLILACGRLTKYANSLLRLPILFFLNDHLRKIAEIPHDVESGRSVWQASGRCPFLPLFTLLLSD